ncbi:mfs transporter [Ophiostoma piceae UAMH 11346]|uniref:Mfs transporter n=1 Tax=Ophiostoma piceae (strain UAMH 11346) TaxID=1262450 RepID=S3C938_OPHP1|nr:mfs transporter [Ophiostoma piceae UAMH 11346]
MDENLDDSAIQIMRDVGDFHFVKAQDGHTESPTDSETSSLAPANVLVPQPANDPDDPLNWSPSWKAAAIFSATALSFTLNLGPLALAPMFGSYMIEWDCSLADAVQFTGVAILVLGFSNFLWVPIMVTWGRRPVAISSTLLCVCSSIWRARATSYGSFMGASVLNGIGAGPCETLMPQVIADIVFLHDRGKYQTLYFSMYFISLMVGPIISGAMDYHTGWRSFWWFNTGLLMFALVVQIVLFPETQYDRTAAMRRQREQAHSAADTHSRETTNNNEPAAAHTDGVSTDTEKEPAALHTPPPAPIDSFLGISRPSKKHFRLYVKNTDLRMLWRELWLPWYLFVFPIVEFAAFVVSWSAASFLVVNLSQSQAFAAPPYNYSSQTIGLFNISVFVWAGIGLFTCGPLSDMVAAWFTRRNNGVREPEMRLVAIVPYVAALIVGSVVTAVGYDRHWPWQVIVIVGYGLLGMQVTALPSIVSTYAIDSYRPVTGSMFVAITVNKNLWGYGISKFLTAWSEKDGFIAPVLTNMGLAVFFCLLAVPFWFYGKKLRGYSRKSFVHRL